jgi:ferredoxin
MHMASQDPASKARLRVVADRGACCGYGVCAEICPEIFGVDDNGIVIVKLESVPPALEEKAREGVQACPQSALAIKDLPG